VNVSEYDDATAAAQAQAADDETTGEARSESAESAEQGPADLTEAARLLGAGQDDSAIGAADEDADESDLGAPPEPAAEEQQDSLPDIEPAASAEEDNNEKK